MLKKVLVLASLFVLTGATAVLALRGAEREDAPVYSMVGTPLSALGMSGKDDDYSLSLLRYFKIAATKVTTDYVDPDRVEPVTMLRGALDNVARNVPEFLYRFDPSARTLRLVLGLDERELPVSDLDGVPALADLLTDVAGFLDEHLAGDAPRREVEYAMMNGMLRTLDPHSFFIDPDAYKEMESEQEGHFGGLGITIGIRDGRLTVLYPLADTPAYKAGLSAGDHIDKIGRESTVNMDLADAVERLRGEVGTEVTITVSDDSDMRREVTLTRARIETPSLKSAYAGDGIGYVQIQHFHKDTYDRLEDALDALDTEAIGDEKGGLQGLVLDLRGNPGGYLEQAYLIANKFIISGTIVSTEGMAGTAKEQKTARRFGTEDDLPLVVLVDAGSASASEIVAGALKNQNRAVVLGTRTFGKGSVQNLYERNFDNGALKLTIARYLTPGDVSIQGLGILPDVEVRPAFTEEAEDGRLDVRLYWEDFELREEDLSGAFQWGTKRADEDRPSFVISCSECWDDPTDRSREETAADNLRLPQVQAAKALLLAAPTNDRTKMLAKVPEVVPQVLAERQAELEGWLGEHGIDWGAPPPGYSVESAALKVEVRVESEGGTLVPGAATNVTLEVTNEGSAPLYRLRAVTQGDFFAGREYVYGRLGPGETRSFTVAARPRLWLNARTEEVTWHFFAEGAGMPEPVVGRLQISEAPKPRFAYSWALIDDGSGTTSGNGDGVLQAGEAVDLLVRVKNIGEGATSEIWRGEQGLLRGNEDADGDGVADRDAGFVRFKNTSGDALFLDEGVASFRLRPGESSAHRLHFRVGDDLAGVARLTGELVVGDESFLDPLTSELAFPVSSMPGAVVADDRMVKPRGGKTVTVRAGASGDAPAIARLEGPVASTGRLGDWVRIDLGDDGAGWVPGDQIAAASRLDKPVAPARWLPNSPPVISLIDSPGGSVVSSDSVTVRGRVTDDVAVKDLYVFVRDATTKSEQKISYERLARPVGTHEFTLEIPLEPGVNEIELFSRDEQDLKGSISLGLYRETARAQNEAAMSPVVR